MTRIELFNSLRAAIVAVEDYLWEAENEACIIIADDDGAIHCPGCTMGVELQTLQGAIDDYFTTYHPEELDKVQG